MERPLKQKVPTSANFTTILETNALTLTAGFKALIAELKALVTWNLTVVAKVSIRPTIIKASVARVFIRVVKLKVGATKLQVGVARL